MIGYLWGAKELFTFQQKNSKLLKNMVKRSRPIEIRLIFFRLSTTKCESLAELQGIDFFHLSASCTKYAKYLNSMNKFIH